MKNLKKWLSLALAAVAFTSVFSLVSCDEDGDGKYSQYKSGTGGEYDRYEVECGTYKVTVPNAGAQLYFSFWTDKGGTYSVSSSGASAIVDPKINFCNASSVYINVTNEGNDNKSATDKNFYFEYEVNPNYLYNYDEDGNKTLNTENRTTFMISIDDSVVTSYPVSFDVTFTLLEINETLHQNKLVTTEERNLSIYPERPANSALIGVDYDSTIVYSETDRFYHIGEENGPVLLVLLDNPTNGRFTDKAFTHRDFELSLSHVDSGIENLSYNYIDLIQRVYGQYCNTDGVYGVTKELRLFLERYIIGSGNFGEIPSYIEASKKWLGPCYYYQQTESVEN